MIWLTAILLIVAKANGVTIPVPAWIVWGVWALVAMAAVFLRVEDEED